MAVYAKLGRSACYSSVCTSSVQLALLLLSLQHVAAWSSPDLLEFGATTVKGGSQQRVATDNNSPRQLMQCINEAYVPKNATWSSIMNEDLASLKAAGVWWSSKPTIVPVTVVTQLSVNRLQQLWAQCRSWRGPLSAAVYAAVEQRDPEHLSTRNAMLLRGAVKQVSALFEKAERDRDVCKLDITLVFEQYTERRAMMLYPVNALRNLARLQARTDLLALMDVDMLISSQFVLWLREPERVREMVQKCREKTVYVLPAFETYGNTTAAAAMADKLSTTGKSYLALSVMKGIAAPFDAKRFALGHNATNFSRWYMDDDPFEIQYSYRYEPWVIVDRHLAPWHDVRFRGYGQNKIVHIAHINSTGFKFVVHPRAYIIHRAHEQTSARVQLIVDMDAYRLAVSLNQTTERNTIYGFSKWLFDNAKADMDAGHFEPVLDPQARNCMATLPWWGKDSQ